MPTDPTLQPPPPATPGGTAFVTALQGLLGNQQARLGQQGGIRRRAYEDLRMRGLLDQLLSRQRTTMGDLRAAAAQPGLSPQILGMLAQIAPRPGFTSGAGRLAYQYAPGGQAGVGTPYQGQYPTGGSPPGGVWAGSTNWVPPTISQPNVGNPLANQATAPAGPPSWMQNPAATAPRGYDYTRFGNRTRGYGPTTF